jgi:ABC-2 type transport system ATP-binding protein
VAGELLDADVREQGRGVDVDRVAACGHHHRDAAGRERGVEALHLPQPLHEPPIIFLDEPTSGVDPISRRRFWELIYELAGQGVTVFVTTHYMDEAEYCGRLGLIYRGELIASGPPEVLKAELMREDVLEVACERPQDALGEIEGVAGVKEAALFGNGLHVVVEQGAAASRAVRERLHERGFQVERVEQIVPSLEDVFVSLIEARDRVEQPQQEVRG